MKSVQKQKQRRYLYFFFFFSSVPAALEGKMKWNGESVGGALKDRGTLRAGNDMKEPSREHQTPLKRAVKSGGAAPHLAESGGHVLALVLAAKVGSQLQETESTKERSGAAKLLDLRDRIPNRLGVQPHRHHQAP